MHLSRDHGLIFVHNQKTGGLAMEEYLRNNFGDLEMFLPRHAYTEDGIPALGRAAWDRCFSFGFVRNPWARLVSWYSMIQERKGRNDLWQYVRENASSFEQFMTTCTATVFETDPVENPGGRAYRKNFFRNQIDYFTDENGRIAVSFIGKFEVLQQDFSQVQRALGRPPSHLARVNATQAKDYRSYYNEETREIVAQRFQKDIDHFGYTFDNGYPE